DNIDETGSDYTEAPDTSAESDIHDSHFGMNFCQRNVPLEVKTPPVKFSRAGRNIKPPTRYSP
ncbi:hypothetical protein ACJMK2_014763, partial [Sinanodonta woodiana]